MVKTWDDLIREIKQKVSDAMQDDVFQAVKEVYQKHIDEDVYDTGSGYYRRRDASGGLIADENIQKTKIGDMGLEVRNMATPSSSLSPKSSSGTAGQLAEWIEHGDAYKTDAQKAMFGHYSNKDFSGEAWASPRPFTRNTIEDLKANKQHKFALINGLRKRGINAK